MSHFAVLLLFVVTASLLLSSYGVDGQDARCYPCKNEWTQPVYYPSFADCDGVWKCEGGRLSSFKCKPGYKFDFYINRCLDENLAKQNDLIYSTRKLMPNAC